MKYIGYFNVESNSIYITDPCYDPPTKNSKNNCELAIPNGVWFAYTKESCYTKNAELLISKTKFNDNYNWEKLTSIAVDSGQAGFFDSKHYNNDDDVDNYRLADFGDDYTKWYKMVCHITIEKGCDVIPFGVVSRSGHGDGKYKVYISKNNSLVNAVKIIFN